MMKEDLAYYRRWIRHAIEGRRGRWDEIITTCLVAIANRYGFKPANRAIMNYDEMAREIEDALGEQHFVSTSQACRAPIKEERIDCIAAKLKELFPIPEDYHITCSRCGKQGCDICIPETDDNRTICWECLAPVKVIKSDEDYRAAMTYVDEHMDDDDNPDLEIIYILIEAYERRILKLTVPKDLEATISPAFVDTDIGMGDVGYVEDVSGRITEAVAPFCQKPEVPESLEAAVREGLEQLKRDKWRDRYLPEAERVCNADTAAYVISAVAPLLAERDNRIKVLEDLVNEVSETLAPLQISHRHLYPWDWLNKARVYFGNPPVEESPDED